MKIDRLLCSILLLGACFIQCKTQNQFRKHKRILKSFFSAFMGFRNKFLWNEQVFFQEGSSVRQAAISGILGKYDPDDYISHEVPMQVKCIGYGFWNGICRAVGLNKLLKIRGIRINCHHSMLEGRSFARTLLAEEAQNQENILTMSSKCPRRIYRCLGTGRALAWLDPDEELYDISSCPAFKSLLAGKVLAYCFTQVHDAPQLIKKIKSLKEIYVNQDGVIDFAYLTALNIISIVSKDKKDYLINKYDVREDLSKYTYQSLCNKLLSVGI